MSTELKRNRILTGLLNSPSPVRLAIVGVGQILRRDDGAGPAVIERLRALTSPSSNLLLIDADHAPENVLGTIIRFAPTHVIYIDAIRYDDEPGSIHWLLPADIEEYGGSTHSLSLSILAEYLRQTTGALIMIAGIQPESMDFSIGLSAKVQEAVEILAADVASYWRKATTACSAMSVGSTSVVSN